MNVKQLRKLLNRSNVPKDMIYLNIKRPGNEYSKGNTFCLGFTSNKWEVYYSERGGKDSVKLFENESEACEYFYNWVIKYCKQ